MRIRNFDCCWSSGCSSTFVLLLLVTFALIPRPPVVSRFSPSRGRSARCEDVGALWPSSSSSDSKENEVRAQKVEKNEAGDGDEREGERERSTGWLALEGARYISRRGDVEISQTVIRAPGFFFLSFFFFYLFFIFFAFSRHAVARRVIEGEGEGRLRWWGSGMKRQGERRAKRNNVYDRREGFAITCRILRVSPGPLLVFLPPLRFFFSFFSFYSVFVSLFILFFFAFSCSDTSVFRIRLTVLSTLLPTRQRISEISSPPVGFFIADERHSSCWNYRDFFFKSWNSGRRLGFMSVGEAGAKWCSKFKIQRKRGCTEKNK